MIMENDLVLFGDIVPAGGSGPAELPVERRKPADVVDILQPKTVTYAKYRFSSKIYYHLLAHIREELTAYIDNNFNHLEPGRLIRVPVFCSHYSHFNRNVRAFREFVAGLMRPDVNLVSFSWRFDAQRHADMYRWMMMQDKNVHGVRVVLPKDGAEFKVMSYVIVNQLLCDDPNVVLVDINPVMVPFLLYYGIGNGGTCFNRDVYLKLNSIYSFRLYEFIMDWSTSTSVRKMSIDELRSYLGFPASYSVTDLKKRVLDVAKAEIEAAGSTVLFDYDLKYDSEYGFAGGTRGRLPANCIVFSVTKKEYVDWKELSRKQILVMVQGVADREKQHLCPALARAVVEAGNESLLKSKFMFYDKRVSLGKMRPEEYKNTMLKIIREVTGVDLRSDSHIRNSIRSRRKYKCDGNEPKLLFE